MYVSQIGNINNAAFGQMQNRNAMTNMARGAGNGSFKDLNSIHQSEKGLQVDNLQNQFAYSATTAMEESEKKREKENIKRTFSTFA
jgi:hypothetical protein